MTFKSLPNLSIALICEICILMDSQFEKAYEPNTLTLLHSVIDKVSWIFRTIDWDESGVPDNIGFKIQIVTRSWNLLPFEHPGRYYQKKNARLLLPAFGQADYSRCCIALGLTMRPFQRNEVAVSIRGDQLNVGGICEFQVGEEEKVTSLNLILISGTGPSGWALSPTQLEMTLVHELGHSFGSKHDFDLSHSKTTEVDLEELRICSGHDPNLLPRGDSRIQNYRLFEPVNGRFIMWPSSFQGKTIFRKNNYRFSPCSKRSVSEILNNFRQQLCFVHDSEPFCGNGILESTEECDCGLEIDCNLQNCCGSRQSQRPCQLISNSTTCPVKNQITDENIQIFLKNENVSSNAGFSNTRSTSSSILTTVLLNVFLDTFSRILETGLPFRP